MNGRTEIIGDKLFDQAVAPSDCSLLVALPLTKEAFRDDVATAVSADPNNARGDFAASLAVQDLVTDIEGAWHRLGAPTSELVKELADVAETVGVGRIDLAATADSLAAACKDGFHVIILLAHWRSARLVSRDLAAGFADIFNAADKADDIDLAELHEFFANHVHPRQPNPGPRLIANAINHYMRDLDAEAHFALREALEKSYPDHIVPGNAVELRDGYHKADELGARVDPIWSGIVDLGVCHSFHLAYAIKQGRNDRRVLTNEAAKYPIRCMREITEALVRLSGAPQSYIPMRVDIHKTYNEIVSRSLQDEGSTSVASSGFGDA